VSAGTFDCTAGGMALGAEVSRAEVVAPVGCAAFSTVGEVERSGWAVGEAGGEAWRDGGREAAVGVEAAPMVLGAAVAAADEEETAGGDSTGGGDGTGARETVRREEEAEAREEVRGPALRLRGGGWASSWGSKRRLGGGCCWCQGTCC